MGVDIKTNFDLVDIASENTLVYVNESRDIMTQVNSSMPSTDLRAAKAHINRQKLNADKERTRLKKLMLNRFEEIFAELYETETIDEYHKEVTKMLDSAIKAEREIEIEKIESIITEVNGGQVDRELLPNAKIFINKSESYIKSYIDDKICDILFIEEEQEVAPEPQTPVAKSDVKITFTIECYDRELAKEINTLCRSAGEKVKVTTKKG